MPDGEEVDRRVAATQEFAQHSRNDLPRQSESIAEPPALLLFAAFGGRIPQAVHLILGFAVDQEGNGFGEREQRSAV